MPGKVSAVLDKFRMTEEDREKFFQYLDTLPEKDRAIYAFHGQKASAWKAMGGGTSHIIGLFFADRLVISTRGMMKVSTEKDHKEYPIDDVTAIDVHAGPLLSSVTIQFKDGSKIKISDVDHKEAEPLARFGTERLAAFDRSKLDLKTFNAMFLSYVMSGQPLPDFLKHHGKSE